LKRPLTLLLSLALILALTACGGAGSDPSGSGDAPPGSGQQEQGVVQTPDVKEPDETPDPGKSPEQGGTEETPEPSGGETVPPEVKDPTPSEPQETVPHKGGEDGPGEPVELRPGTMEDPPSARETPESLWDKLGGCWVAVDGDRFAYFTYTDDGPAFWSGEWENPIPYRREAASVTGLTAFEGGIFTLSVTYPPIEEDAADEQELRPLLYTMALDISELENGVIRVEAPEDQWRDYTWGGVSYDDAYDASYSATPYAAFAEMQGLWTELGGYWVDNDGRFIYFDQMDSNTLLFMDGVREAGGGRGYGTFEKAMTPLGNIPLEFIIYYPPVENELDGAFPALDLRVAVDITDLYAENTLHVKLGEGGEWVAYTYAGDSLDG